VSDYYTKISDLPSELPVFPLRGVILLPRCTLPLNVFEPRYLTLVNDVLAGERMIAIVQPEGNEPEESPQGRSVPLRRVGCAGRLTAFQETEDNRVLISLTGVCRFDVAEEVSTDLPYRIARLDYSRFADDLQRGKGEDDVDRERLLKVLRDYLEVNELQADWDSINRSANEPLVNTLSMLSPYGPEEKQALLEAATLKERAEALIALAEMDMAGANGDSGSTIQ